MTPERWQQVKSTLADALDCEDTSARVEFLSRTCGADLDLRAEVQSLLDQPADEFETVAQTIGLAHSESFAPSHAGRHFGAYELIRELGRGGMGTVWLARRADDNFEKLVAIKLLKRGTDTDEVLSRFHAERKILARLDHPNIARLFDAGTTDDGLPYFVMEYVEGTRLTDFVRRRQISLGERLRLFLKICSAVEFAHQNLIVHRDLKPANIFVTEEGEPKLLDFGVAKLLAPENDAWHITLEGKERFTPGYASPEQVRGEPATTVSDVYSLGALLYEVLAGVPSHRFPTATPTAAQISEIVCGKELARASSVALPPEVRRHLRGDLDTILLRALAKDPRRRYRGAGQLADDLRRYLEDKPVRARPDTFSYRARKFIRRNKALTAAAALIFLSLLAGVIATAREARIAHHERARAERRFNDVRKIANSLMFELHNSIADLPGALAARQLVTQRAVEYLDSLAQEAGDDLSLKSELAAAYNKIGGLTFGLHEAISTRQKAVALNEALVRAAPENAAYRVQLSESYETLSDAMKIAGHSRAAIDDARKSLAVLQTVANATPAQLAERHVAVAIALADAGDFRGTLQSAQTALQIQLTLEAQDPADKKTRRDLEAPYALVSDASAEAGAPAEAMAFAKKALAIAQEMFNAEPSNSRRRRDMWATNFRLGHRLSESGEMRSALQNYQQGLEFIERLAAADPNDTGHQRWLALTFSAMGDAHAGLEQRTEALRFQEKAIAITEKLAQDDPERVEAQRDLAKICRATGALWRANGEPQRAATYYDRAITISENLRRNDPENWRVRSGLAEAYAERAVCSRELAEKNAAPDIRASHLQRARELCAQSLALWKDVQRNEMITAADAGKPEAAAHALAEYDAILQSPR